jgi:hypothetical protein
MRQKKQGFNHSTIFPKSNERMESSDHVGIMSLNTKILYEITFVYEPDMAYYSFLGQMQVTVTSHVFVIQETNLKSKTNSNKQQQMCMHRAVKSN